jgi:alcohol dehydrogenase class IV
LVALCDPELTLTLPPRLTAGTGMDALSHCIEGFLAKPLAPQIDAIALAGMRRVVEHVARAVRDGADREARWHMLMASLEGGIAIAKGLGPVHAMANAFGDQGLHHGLLCALSLPGSLELMMRHAPQPMAQIAAALGVADSAAVPARLRGLNAELGLPADLRSAGLQGDALDEMSEDAAASPFNRTSPYAPSRAEYAELMAEAIG